MINITLIAEYLPYLLRGALTSLYIAFSSCSIGLAGGTLLALVQTAPNRPLRLLVALLVTIIRGTPMLIQIAFWYYAILPTFGLSLSALSAAIVAIGVNSSAYVSQVIRSGILSVNTGQIEAAKTLGFNKIQIIKLIILPQALRIVLPSLGNEFITLIKDSSLAYTIGVVELYKQSITMQSVSLDAMTTYVAVATIYLLMTTSLSLFMDHLERRMGPHARN